MEQQQKPLITIGIPTYNRANSNLPLAVQCALNQTYENIEVIVSDNCSSDRTSELMREMSDPRLTYFRQNTNVGPNRNFNRCLELAKGDYFLLLHDDDLIDRDFAKSCMDAANNSATLGFIKTGTHIIDVDGAIINESLSEIPDQSAQAFFDAWFTGKSSVYLCSTLFNTRALRDDGGFHSINNLLQDGMAIARISRNHPRINVEIAKASFRHHPDQLTHSADIVSWCEEFGELLKYLADGKQVNTECILVGKKFFHELLLRRTWKMDGRIKRRVARYRVNNYFKKLEL